MYFRCSSCLAATWIGSDRPPAASDTATCHECGRSYVVAPDPALGSTEGSHYRHTASFAHQEHLDMATAYSFLLGLISREELTGAVGLEMDEPALDEEELRLFDALEVEEPAVEEPAARRAPAEAPPTIDPGFQKAVARGRMTMEEALRRGDRSAYASNLSSRYDLTMELAYAVADNRITLFQARKRQQEEPEPELMLPTDPTPTRARSRMPAVLIIVVVAAFGLTWGFLRKETRPSPRSTAAQMATDASNENRAERGTPSGSTASSSSAMAKPTAYSSTQVLTDKSGRVTQVTGLDARTVLQAYCGADKEVATCDPLEIMDTVPPMREVRVGTFRDTEAPHAIHAINIQRNRFTRRWEAGNGEQPIALADPPQLADDGSRGTDADR